MATQKPVVAAPKPQVTGELDMVMAIIDSISHYDARTKQRILAAVARFS